MSDQVLAITPMRAIRRTAGARTGLGTAGCLAFVLFCLFGCDEEKSRRVRDLVEIQEAIDYAEEYTAKKLLTTAEPYSSRDEWPDWAKRSFVRIKLISDYATTEDPFRSRLYYAESQKELGCYLVYERVGGGTLYLSGNNFEIFRWQPGENQFPCTIEGYWHHPKADENGICRAGVCDDCNRACCFASQIH